ncbi:MAG: F0F1 ATP synthase subunit B [Oscillospiraceae bacterium]|nr:F0F1 ATP synthase subunit B [Oscillospiraceae bacterium]
MVSPGEYLSFLSIDKWTIIFNLINTLILYKIIKKFLFGPVNKIINDRKSEIKQDYDRANKTLEEATDLKKDYENKINNSNQEALEIIDSAKVRATEKYNEIINEARDKASNLINKANKQIELESKKAINNIKDEVADIAVLMAAEVLKKEISLDDHKKIIDKFFDEASER